MKKIITLLFFLSMHLSSFSAERQKPHKLILANGAITGLFAGSAYCILRSTEHIVISETPRLTMPSISAFNLGLLSAGVTCACLATYSAWKTCESIKQTFIIK